LHGLEFRVGELHTPRAGRRRDAERAEVEELDLIIVTAGDPIYDPGMSRLEVGIDFSRGSESAEWRVVDYEV
jgi:hypothetical protein